MEILMKLKCSPSVRGSSPRSTLKIVDHHRQLHQQLSLLPGSHLQLDSNSKHPPPRPTPPPPPLHPAGPMDCSNPSSMSCCVPSDMPWNGGACSAGMMCDRAAVASCCQVAVGPPQRSLPPPPCCSGALPYDMTSPPPLQFMAEPSPLRNEAHFSSSGATNTFDSSYEYQESEDNFVSIDDEKIKGFLMKIGESEKRRKDSERKKQNAQDRNRDRDRDDGAMVFEIIELDDEGERAKLNEICQRAERAAKMLEASSKESANREQREESSVTAAKRSRRPPNGKERIIAKIDLIESSSSESEDQGNAFGIGNDDDDEELPLAAAAVSCELDCDDDDDEHQEIVLPNDDNNSDRGGISCEQEVITLLSDDEKDDDDLEEREENSAEPRWGEVDNHKERTLFECFLCGKTVQSSYNLRRHMMIHTGERPFACDMCDRRFREFSDLKKHRRRHAKHANFVCMVCRVKTPTESDSTRCDTCDLKTATIVASRQREDIFSTATSQGPPATGQPLTGYRTIKPKPSNGDQTTAASIERRSSPPQASPSKSNSPRLTVSSVSVTEAETSQEPGTTSVVANAISSTAGQSDTNALLDNIPAVHRPSFNQLGVITRKEFPCPLCQRAFGTRHNLKRHFMIHTGEKPFSCPKCRKPFREYSTLKKHMVTHWRDRWYKCLRCPQKYRDYLDYVEHKHFHADSGDERASSSNGGAGGGSSDKRKSKSKSASEEYYDSMDEDSAGEDWIECCECNQRFTDIETYTDHLKEHDASLYLYECYICKRTFSDRDQLTRHMSQHDEQEEEEDEDENENENDDDGMEVKEEEEEEVEDEVQIIEEEEFITTRKDKRVDGAF